MRIEVEAARAVLVRLESATGADAELDKAISAAVGFKWDAHWTAGSTKWTRSIDAADALRERLFSDWFWRLQFNGLDYCFTMHGSIIKGEHTEGIGKTKCLAILIAIFQAILAREDGK